MNEIPPSASPASPASPASLGDRMRSLIGELEVLQGCRSAAPTGLADDTVAGLSDAAAVDGLSDEGLLAGVVLWERLGKLVDAGRVAVAGEVDARCGVERGDDRLTVKLGFASVPKLLAAHTGTRVSTATERTRLAARLRSGMSLVGVPNPSKFPHVQRALRDGILGIDTAEVITRKLGQVANTVGFSEELTSAEEYLVNAAAQSAGGFGVRADEVGLLSGNLRDRLDPDGVEPRDQCLTEQRSLKFIKLPSGMTKMIGMLPPEDAASWIAIAAAFQSPRTRPTFTANPANSGDANGDDDGGGGDDDGSNGGGG